MRSANFSSLLGALVALFTAVGSPLPAQMADARPVVDSAMAPLTWLVGEWKGEGSLLTPAGSRLTSVHERVESRLDGRILIIEGIGREPLGEGEPGRVVHHAFAVLTYDPDGGRYAMRAFRDGRLVDADSRVADGVFTWGFQVTGGQVRYHLWNDGDEWLETGEFSSDGTVWRPFFEMRLRRSDASR